MQCCVKKNLSGQWASMGCLSRTLMEVESCYSHIEHEMLGVVFVLMRVCKYIFGRKVQVDADNNPPSSIVKKSFNFSFVVPEELHPQVISTWSSWPICIALQFEGRGVVVLSGKGCCPLLRTLFSALAKASRCALGALAYQDLRCVGEINRENDVLEFMCILSVE